MVEPEKQPSRTTKPGKPTAAPSGMSRASLLAKPDQPSVRRRLPIALPHWTFWRAVGGCAVAFICVVLVYLGVGGAAVYQGLQERTAMTRQEAEVHYQRGLEHVQQGDYELAVAEFEHTLRLDPTHRQARDALRDAKTVAMAQPTPTSATLNEALNAILAEVESLVQQQKWAEAAERLAQLRDLDPSFQAGRVSELLFQANFNLGQQLTQQGQVAEAGKAYERALKERPDDPEAGRQFDLASLYLAAKSAWGSNWPQAINSLEQLYTLIPDYVDVAQLLSQAYEGYGDALAAQNSWCDAEPQYMQAAMLQPGAAIQDKQARAKRICETPTPAVPAIQTGASTTLTATTALTGAATPGPAAAESASGSILLSWFNKGNGLWEIVAVPPSGGPPSVVLENGTQPAVSTDGRLLAYHSEVGDSIGIHVRDLVSGQDTRATQFMEDVTPDWAPDGAKFAFPSRRSGNRRWTVYVGWADGRGDAVTLVDGRTPAWSPDGTQVAYQGTDPQGNNPGLYVVGAGGGPSNRITDHESDRAPAWSPDGSRIAFMSSRGGRWQLYVLAVKGGALQPFAQSGGNDGLPAWSPDGSRLAFVSDRDGTWGVYVTPAAGGQTTRVADWGGSRKDWLIERISWRR